MSVDAFLAALPPRTAARAGALRKASRGPRSVQDGAAFEQRIAEIRANLAIEGLVLSTEELAFFKFAFQLNVAQEEERALCRLWNQERAAALVIAAE